MPSVAAAYCIHDDTEFFDASIRSILARLPPERIFAFISSKSWAGQDGDVCSALEIARRHGVEVIEGCWESELDHRTAIHEELASRDFDYVLTIDSDEILERELLDNLIAIAEANLADRVRVTLDTYWHSHEYRIRPRERLALTMLVSIKASKPIGLREFEGGRELVLPDTYGIMHHLSYAGSPERIEKKINSWSHRDQVDRDWFTRVWRGWEQDHLMRDLHPTHPAAYGFAERIAPPGILQELLGSAARPVDDLPTPKHEVSVIIPLYGGEEDIRDCLTSLGVLTDLIEEVIVVDNASPDKAASVAKSFDGVTVIENSENNGFAAACNQGAECAQSPYLLFLNSDTIIHRQPLLRLIESLEQSSNTAAVGPYSNYAGYSQQISPTYTAKETISYFVEDFASRSVEDVDVDHLVGFCLLVRNNVFEEVGGFDEQFGLGLFEDTELCYRFIRSGYKLKISSRSFVHHRGSRSLPRTGVNSQELLVKNRQLYSEKWSEDVECGFTSHLPALRQERVVWRQDLKPESRRARARELSTRADISLCMIVKDEERVLAACLKSAAPFFAEIIVVDTGSSDKTTEIAESFGARVLSFPWTDSFSEARNESLRHASGKWIFWMDADDTLPLKSGEVIQECALTAPDSAVGFIVPVQFVDEGPNAGTRVDHIKLFRNKPGLQFEGRIHEQILPSLRAFGGDIARCNAVVYHSGYDYSPAGQQRKRERDFKLLELDLKDRPDHPFVLFNLGMTHQYTGSYEAAVVWMRRCIEKSKDFESHKRKAYVHLAQSLRALGRKDEAFRELQIALEKFPDDQEIPFHLAISHTERKEYEVARECYLRTLAADPAAYFSSLDVGLAGFKTFHNLGVVARFRNCYQEACDWWRKALLASPHHLDSAVSLFEYALEVRDLRVAQEAMEIVRRAEGESRRFIEMFAAYHETLGGIEQAIQMLALHVSQSGTVDWGMALIRRQLNAGRIAEAIPRLALLANDGVAEAAYQRGVVEIRRGELKSALEWMERAHSLNPSHQGTKDQVASLKEALADPSDPAAG